MCVQHLLLRQANGSFLDLILMAYGGWTVFFQWLCASTQTLENYYIFHFIAYTPNTNGDPEHTTPSLH